MASGSDLIMEILARAEEARTARAIGRLEEILIIHASTLSARRVRSVMVPAEDVKVFDPAKSLHENVCDLGPRLHRSYPVGRGGSFAAAGDYIILRDALAADLLTGGGGRSDWHTHARPLPEWEGSSPLADLLTAFLEGSDTAAVVKKDGANIGWITLDDIIATLLGARG